MASMMLLGASAAQAWTDAGCCYEDPCCEDQTGFYIGGFGGANFISTSRNCGHNRRNFDTGYVLSASLGYRWCHNVRFEFEYAYRNNKGHHRHHYAGVAEGADVALEQSYNRRRHRSFFQNAYMFNGFYDLDMCNDWCLKPFVGAGVGYAQNRHGHHNFYGEGRHKNKQNGFAWQIIAGLAYPICDEVDLSIEYRYFRGRDHHLNNNDVGVGLKYYF